MLIIKLSATFFAISLFMMVCDGNPPPQTATVDPYQNQSTELDDYWAKDNLDLQRVGDLLERSNNPQEFEAYLNDDDGINNLDFNGDGYVDYISVDEFGDRDSHERGLSLFSRFGPDLIQEIAQIFFYRDDPYSSGARIYVRGDDRIYGDNYYYETNWLDRTIPFVTMLFTDRGDYYRSPYYYDHYPPDYVVYEVVETPIYRTRIERLYPQPVFVFTAAPVFLDKIKIKSPNNGLHLGQIYAKLAKPTKEQSDFLKGNPRGPKVKAAKVDNADKPGKADTKVDKADKPENAPQPGQPEKADKPGKPDVAPGKVNQPKEERKPAAADAKPSKPAQAEKQTAKPAKADNPGKNPGQGGGQGKGGGGGKGKKP